MIYKAMKYLLSSVVALLVGGVTMTSCQNEDELTVKGEAEVVAVVPDKVLDDANPFATRSSLIYEQTGTTTAVMRFDWETTDQIGVFNVIEPAEGSTNIPFTFKEYKPELKPTYGSAASFSNDNYFFSRNYYWVAYSPYKAMSNGGVRTKVLSYDNISITYTGQAQQTNATPKGMLPGATNSGYGEESEKKASAHLADYDYLISAPAQPGDDGWTKFYFQHVGSTVRFFLWFPEGAFGGAGKSAKITNISVVHKNSNVLVSDAVLAVGQETMESVSTQPNFTVKSTTTTQKLDLKCTGTDGSGISVPDHGYMIAYMEFFPTNIGDKDCLLYITAEVDGMTRYFRSKPLYALNIESGHLYQWATMDFDAPIQLTSTLAKWQDVWAEEIDITL